MYVYTLLGLRQYMVPGPTCCCSCCPRGPAEDRFRKALAWLTPRARLVYHLQGRVSVLSVGIQALHRKDSGSLQNGLKGSTVGASTITNVMVSYSECSCNIVYPNEASNDCGNYLGLYSLQGLRPWRAWELSCTSLRLFMGISQCLPREGHMMVAMQI